MAGNNWFDGNRYMLLGLFFICSGFLSLLYQTVWLRLAFAHFGVITPVISVVVSVFMLGLGIGSFFGGRYISVCRQKVGLSAIGFYGLAELVIGAGSIAVPHAYAFFENVLLSGGETGSVQYLFFSACAIAASILPFAIAMGATFPCAMSYLAELGGTADKRSFGYLYLANVAGAVGGVLMTVLVFIEVMGFQHTLMLAGSINLIVAAIAFCWATSRGRQSGGSISTEQQANLEPAKLPGQSRYFSLILFTSGFVSMAMEIVWIRSFTPVLGTVVYSFAGLLAVYLLSTWVGTGIYRWHIACNKILSIEALLAWTAIFSLLPILLNDPRWNLPYCALVALLSIAPFCASLGYLTPLIVDEYSQGSAAVAGLAYAINVIGGIIGPLIAGYCLLPWLGAKQSLLLLGLALIALAVVAALKRQSLAVKVLAGLSIAMAFMSLFCYGLEDGILLYDSQKPHMIRRDYAATTIAFGQGLHKMLVVNGSSMTGLGPETKWMAVLPLAFCRQPGKSALTICFGMGTTFRSLLSWGVKTTAVELVPSVRDSFPFFYDDAQSVLANPKGRIVIDDGRRFLKRTTEKFDVITIDPPPPVQAAGSSLLYSEEFYRSIKEHLNAGGILQQWYPFEDDITPAVARSLRESFPYIRVYRSVAMHGYHFLCSMTPISALTADELIKRMPPQAVADLAEPVMGRDKGTSPFDEAKKLLADEDDINKIASTDKDIKITDDLPYNEYFWLRLMQPAH